MESSAIQETMVKTGVLEERLDNLSSKIDEIHSQNQAVMPMIAELSLSLKNIDLREIQQTQKVHAEKIQEHEDSIASLKAIAQSQVSMVRASKIFWRAIVAVFAFVALIAGAYYAFDRHADRNADRAMKDREHAMMIKIKDADIEQKKKHQDNLMTKYKIRHGENIIE